MRELERTFPDVLAIVGVHSGKFVAERETARIREASLRLGVTHPVVNDRHFRVWRGHAVRAWPTIVVLDARGRVVGQHAGEFSADEVAPFLERLVAAARADGSLAPAPRTFAADLPAAPPGPLRYPGKLALDGRRLAIADGGHHRVLVGTLDDGGRRLRVTHVAGGGAPGLADGPLAEARFTAPQGLAFDGDALYVADAGNHAVRALSLAAGGAGTVRTLAGTGERVRTAADRAAGAMASPWDLALHEGTLYVAMAGTHQLWALDPADGRARVHAGQGSEDIDDDLLRDALLAQPMGVAAHDGRLWFADAETSAVRWADLAPDGRVGTVVGTGLFDFGDADGVGDAVRLQHPQHVAVDARTGRLLVTDSYNDALRWVDPATRTATTWVRGLHEPGAAVIGGAAVGGAVYVADTNAHRVLRVDAGTAAVEVVEVVLPAGGAQLATSLVSRPS